MDGRTGRAPMGAVGETDTLLGFLGYLRLVVVNKLGGLTDEQVRSAGTPSGTSLLGAVTHLTAAESYWIQGVGVDDWDATWRPAAGAPTAELVGAYRAAGERSDAVVRAYADLGEPGPVGRGDGVVPPMRWTLSHVIVETARHAGHVDILREALDGATGL